jgi:hypothetical protein
MSRKEPELVVHKKVRISPDLAERVEDEIKRAPTLYRNDNGQISEGELYRRAVVFYLDTVANQSTDGQRQTA